MADLNRLIADRNITLKAGTEDRIGGNVWTFSHTNVTGTLNGNPCTWCWISPATGTAVVELWGASGSGVKMCCCGGNGLPGNPGGYLKKSLSVIFGSYICGWVGCSPTGDNIVFSGRSGCSVACPFNTDNNNVLMASGGWSGHTVCTTGTALFCCLRSLNFCNTTQGSFCGIICNLAGPNFVCSACACGGDVNICGGVSCVRMFECCNFWECNYENTIAISPGIFSSVAPTCVRFMRSGWPYEAYARHGGHGYSLAMSSLAGIYPQDRVECWTIGSPVCGCYEWSGCVLGGVGFPGTSGHPCPGVRSMGQKGGHGGVKITFYQ